MIYMFIGMVIGFMVLPVSYMFYIAEEVEKIKESQEEIYATLYEEIYLINNPL